MAPGQCDWLTGQSIMMDGGNALANGSGFYDLRHWTDDNGGPRANASRRRTRRIARSASVKSKPGHSGPACFKWTPRIWLCQSAGVARVRGSGRIATSGQA